MIINKNKFKVLLSTLLITAGISQAQAEVNINGFGSIRAGQMISTDGANPLLPDLYNDDDFTFEDESLFALQFSSDLGDGFSATVQLMAEGKNDWDLEAKWAYVAYEFDGNHTLKAGRLSNPLFYNSEYENVGYTHNFARLPKSVYWGFDFATIEGISLDSSWELGDYYLNSKVLYGNWDGDLKAGSSDYAMVMTDILAVNLELSKDWWSVFAGAQVSEVDLSDMDSKLVRPSIDPYLEPSGASELEQAAFVDLMTVSGDGLYVYAGFKIDYDNWLVDMEVSDYAVQDSLDPNNTNWYFAVGKRFNDYVVTVHHEEYTQDVDDNYLSSVTNPVLNGVGNATLNSFADEVEMDVITVRWDFHPSAALKADYFVGKDNQADGGDFSGFSVGVDFVF
jgi:hypothetical protein